MSRDGSHAMDHVVLVLFAHELARLLTTSSAIIAPP
jgi:hypothetical protein